MTKFLFNSEFRAIRKGEFVAADENHGEFISTENNELSLTLGQLQEIASSNGIEITATKKADVLSELFAQLDNLEIPTMNEKTDSQKVLDIVSAGHEAGKSEDEMLIEIVQAGIKFSNAVKYLKGALQELGLMISPKDRYESAKEIMEQSQFRPTSYEEVKAMATELTEQLPDTNEKQAVAAIRKYCREIEVEMPKAPKGAGAVKGWAGPMTNVLDWLMQNADATDEQLAEFLVSIKKVDKEGKPDKFVKKFSMMRTIINKARETA